MAQDEKKKNSMSEVFDESYESGQEQETKLSGEKAAERFGVHRSSKPFYVVVHRNKEKIKPKRGIPEVNSEDFFSSLTQSVDGRVFYHGILNNWSGLDFFEVAKVESCEVDSKGKLLPEQKLFWKSSQTKINKSKKSLLRFMTKSKRIARLPTFPNKAELKSVKITAYLPRHMENGFTPSTPGFVWYHFGAGDVENNQFAHGTNIIKAAKARDKEIHGKECLATKVYHIGHRYAKKEESDLDKKIYHSAVFIEWEHGEYGSIVELAWLNGIGGYEGRSNWIEDRDKQPYPSLYKMMPQSMRAPYNTKKSEIRLFDVPMKSISEIEKFFEKYEGPDKRFIDPGVHEAYKVSLQGVTKSFLARLLCNRIINDSEYRTPSAKDKDMGLNCQTFSAKLLSVLSNKKSNLYSVELESSEPTHWYTNDQTSKPIELEYI